MGDLRMMGRHDRLVGIFNSRTRPAATSAKDIHDALLNAIIVQDLLPGARLGEEMLVEVFNLGRRHVSAALSQLAWEGLVTHLPNRGARVATPSAAEAREIFAARHAIESGIVDALARATPRPNYTDIETALAQERAERSQGRMREVIRLSGGFHVLLARLSGNRILADQMELLVARTSLLVALYENPGALACWHDDHGAIIDKIRLREPGPAVALMQRHLQALLAGIDLTRQAITEFDARDVFRIK